MMRSLPTPTPPFAIAHAATITFVALFIAPFMFGIPPLGAVMYGALAVWAVREPRRHRRRVAAERAEHVRQFGW